MKVISKIMLGVAFAISSAASAQTADEVIQSYTKARGGIDNINKITSFKVSGKMKQQGMEFPLTMQVITGKAMRMDISVQGMNIVQAYNEADSSGWSINPLQGATTPQAMNAEEKKEAKANLDPLGELSKYKENGGKVEYVAKEEIEGVETHKIKHTKKTGDVEYYFISTEDFTVIKTSSTMKFGDKEIDSETWYSDYKDIAGVKVAHEMTQKAGGQVFMVMTYEKIEANPSIDSSVFAMPK